MEVSLDKLHKDLRGSAKSSLLLLLDPVMARYGRAASQNPIPTFDGPIPSREEIDYDRVLSLPSKDLMLQKKTRLLGI